MQPSKIEIVCDQRIPLRDGRTLSARLWLPRNAIDKPVPALVEYAPFRHHDASYAKDAYTHPWFAEQGYSSIRLDPAGSMNSDGLPMDEYTRQEQEDCVESLAWIAEQTWCSGATGMFGMSWSANTALQVAALNPPSLKAIIPVHGTDDRFTDDIHYKGGCMLTDSLVWGALYQTHMLRPPHPDLDPNWRQRWLDRLHNAPDILPDWIARTESDPYWRTGSVNPDYAAIKAATYLIAGWTDGYTNAAFRLAENLSCPKKLLVGPWGHAFPHLAMPGPQIDFLQEAKRWFDRWLKGVETDIDAEAPMTVFMQHPETIDKHRKQRAGRWLQLPFDHSDALSQHHYYIGIGTLSDHKAPPGQVCVESPLSNGIHAGEWLPHGVGDEMPGNQAEEDTGAVCFDTRPLESEINLFGRAALKLRIRTAAPDGEILLRLNDVRPDKTVALITYAIERLAGSTIQPADSDGWCDLEIRFDAIAQQLTPGHRLRLALSSRAWPTVWPSAARSALEVDLGNCQLTLPVLDPKHPMVRETDFAPLRKTDLTGVNWHREPKRSRVINRTSKTGVVSRTFVKDEGAFEIEESGTIVSGASEIQFATEGEDPLSARAQVTQEVGLQFNAVDISLRTEMDFRADARHFIVSGTTIAYENGSVVHERKRDHLLRRDTPTQRSTPEQSNPSADVSAVRDRIL